MSSTHTPAVQQAARTRDSARKGLRRARRTTFVAAAAATLGFTVLSARAFPGHAKAHRAAVATVSPSRAVPEARARPPAHQPRRVHHRHHHVHKALATSTAQASPAPVAPPQPAPAPAQPQVATPPPAPAPAPQPAPAYQPPVVSSGGS